MPKTYVTANNRTIDMDALRLKNEDVRAVGNMGVNARGDKVDNDNKPVETRNRRVAKQYNKQTNVVNQPVASSIAEAKKLAEQAMVVEEENFVEVEEELATETEVSLAEDTTDEPEVEGLAAAIARAREVKQEEIVPPRKQAQMSSGVKKI